MEDILPYLEKHYVLSDEELEMVSDEGQGRSEQNRALLEIIKERPAFWTVKLTECMKETGKYKELLELLLPPSGMPSGRRTPDLGALIRPYQSSGSHRADRHRD